MKRGCLMLLLLCMGMLCPRVSAQQDAPSGPPPGAFNGLPPGSIPPFAVEHPGDQLSFPCIYPFGDREFARRRNAFDSERPPNPPTWYYYFGPMALQRYTLGNGVVALTDTSSAVLADTGVRPTAANPAAATFSDISMELGWGVRALVGYQYGFDAIELSGFYVPSATSEAATSNRGRLDALFGLFPTPPLFAATNNVWLQADVIEQQLELQMFNIEVNWRTTYDAYGDWMFGVRYLDIDERYRITVYDNSLTLPPNPATIASTDSRIHDHIAVFQIGYENSFRPIPWFGVGLFGKLGIGADGFERRYQISRGDGAALPSGENNEIQPCGLAELGATVDLCLFDNLRFRIGYQALWVFNVPEAHAQIDFNPNNSRGQLSTDGTLFFHGPMLELRFAY